MTRRAAPAALVLAALAAGCGGPAYVDKADGRADPGELRPDVVFHVHDAYRQAPPPCVALLPFEGPAEGNAVTPDKVESVRRAVYAHLAPQGKRDIELVRVEFVLGKLAPEQRSDLALVGERLGCGALIRGRVTELGSQYYGVYSRVGIGAELTMVRTADAALLWEGSHIAVSHGGSLPLSPVGLAMGILEAARNVEEEQMLRGIDDLARRLVATIPDDAIAALEDPAAAPSPVRAAPAEPAPPPLPPAPTPTAAGYRDSAERLMAAGDYQGAMGEADAATALDGRNAEAHFLRARALIKLGQAEQAEPAIIEAIALDGREPRYLNALGYLNAAAGKPERALAAYRMATEMDPSNGFAWYNSGVILFNQSDDAGAAEAFYGAGLAYLKAGNYGQAGKALSDLREVAGHGLDLRREIDTLQGALADLGRGG